MSFLGVSFEAGVKTSRIWYCEEKERLLGAFLEAVGELNEIQGHQIQAVIDGDPEFTRFDLLLHLAQENKDRAKYAWIAHVEEHCCREWEQVDETIES